MTMTNASVKQAMASVGVTIREWAQSNGFSESLVYAVLNGRNKATRGESYQIAVALELKKKPELEELPGFLRQLASKPKPGART